MLKKNIFAKFLTFWLPTHNLRKFARQKFLRSNLKKTDSPKTQAPSSILNEGLSINDNGENNIIKIDNPAIFTSSSIQIDADNTFIHIKNAKYIRNTTIFVYNGNNQSIVIGEGTTIEGMTVYLCGEKSSLIIENDCMLANNIQIWTADGHSIIDKNTCKILNTQPSQVVVGEHSWIAQDVKLLKQAQIPKNSIVGASAVVSKTFKEEYTVIAGNPARTVKKDVDWHRDDPYAMSKK